MDWKPEGRNERGHPKKKLKDDLREELEKYNMRKTEAEDRKKVEKRNERDFQLKKNLNRETSEEKNALNVKYV